MKIRRFNENSDTELKLSERYYTILGIDINNEFDTYDDAIKYMFGYYDKVGVVDSYGKRFKIYEVKTNEMTKEYFDVWQESKKYNI